MDFNRIPIVLKRHSFEEKMNIAQFFSRKIMSINGLKDIQTIRNNYLPWELETFTLFSTITNNEYTNNTFDSKKGLNEFHNIMKAIRDYQPPELFSDTNNLGFVRLFTIVTGLTQFQLQENIYFKMYRFKYFFEFKNDSIDMNMEFRNKFDESYNSFMEFGILINMLFSLEGTKHEAFKYLVEKYPKVVNKLAINRDEFIEYQMEVVDDRNQFIYAFRYFYQYPLISENGNTFCPLPHLMIQSITNSLLYRLTMKNNSLRARIGKEVIEEYVFSIVKQNKHNEDVFPEYQYSLPGNNHARTADVMIRKNENFILIDCKSTAPKLELRKLKIETINETVDLMSKQVVQMYRNIKERFGVHYFPFNEKYLVNASLNNVYGIILILEDNYVGREQIYLGAANLLKIQNKSQEYDYLCSNIRIMNLSNFENLIFHNKNITDVLNFYQKSPNKWFDLFYSDEIGKKSDGLNHEISEFEQQYKNLILNFTKELAMKGLIK